MFNLSRKAQGISINTVIIAALALVVLVILVVAFTGRFRIFSEGVDKTGVSCSEGCKLAGYDGGGDSTTSSCDTKLGGSFVDVNSNNKEECCCNR